MLRANATKINNERLETGKNVTSRSEGVGSLVANPRGPKNVSASSIALATSIDQQTQTTSGHNTPRRATKSFGMIEIKSPPPKETVGPLCKGETQDVVTIEEIKSKFQNDFGHCFFMHVYYP